MRLPLTLCGTEVALLARRRRALLARSTDEPFAALDAQLLDTVRQTGQTVLFIIHDLQEAVVNRRAMAWRQGSVGAH